MREQARAVMTDASDAEAARRSSHVAADEESAQAWQEGCGLALVMLSRERKLAMEERLNKASRAAIFWSCGAHKGCRCRASETATWAARSSTTLGRASAGLALRGMDS